MSEDWRAKYKILEKLPFTEEEKERWAAMMHQTWDVIASDVLANVESKMSASIVVEVVCDADYMMTYAGMTKEEDQFMSAIYHRREFQKWAKEVMKYWS